MEKLTEIKSGEYRKVVVVDKSAPLNVRRRLMELGFVAGQKIKLVKKSLLGETFLLEISDSQLSIRKDLAKYLIVE